MDIPLGAAGEAPRFSRRARGMEAEQGLQEAEEAAMLQQHAAQLRSAVFDQVWLACMLQRAGKAS